MLRRPGYKQKEKGERRVSAMAMALVSRLRYPSSAWVSPSSETPARHSLVRAGVSISSSSKRKPSWAAQLVPFKARRQVDVPFHCGPVAPEEYVKEVERVVKITFPDSARIRYMGDSTWRATLKPVAFFHLSATPVCDIRVFHENTALQISSNKLILDFKGFPDQFQHLDFDFSLLGQLTIAEGRASALRRGQNKSFQGWVDLGLKVDMPLPFSMMPQAILKPVGDGILDRILGAMQSALLAGLILDYKQWCRNQTDQTSSLSSDAEFLLKAEQQLS